MSHDTEGAARNDRQRAKDRIITPVKRPLTVAGWLSVLAGALWPIQAAAIAWAVSEWVDGASAVQVALTAASVFLACALLRALLEHRSGALLFAAANATIRRERAHLIDREARTRTSAGSAQIAALLVQKLPLMQPWITRYHVAMMRVSTLPFLYLLLAFSQSWAVGVTLLVAGPLIPVFMALVGMAAEEASKKQMQDIASMNDMVMDRLSAMLDIRLLGATDRAAQDFATRADSLRARTMEVLKVAFLSSTVLELFAALGVAMVAVFVGFTLLGEIGFGAWGDGLTLGEGLFLLLIAPEFFQPLRDLSAAWHDRAAGYAVVADLDALDAAERVAMLGQAAPSEPLSGPLALCTEGAVVALSGKDVRIPDFTLSEGQSLALVGPSGVGKSTALAAIAGLAPLRAGTILVNGQPLTEETADAWRAGLSVVPQKPHFADETLAEWLDPKAIGTDPSAALAMAGASDIVRRLPEGLHSRLGETGGGVSGGEARRLLLARALLSGASLLLADEPTADLDEATADTIITALLAFRAAGGTLLIATHDPRLIAAMDTHVEVMA
ncbi:ABC transporter ATP-binding protein/permease [Shimia marina]|uniref:ATP-binding/permease protein CydD n=1 Tax=Shimia marina TaxID=321267 RepID=A0A0P1EMN4_9RHOB|nr:ATP-binding cassette domain-containing protein [Shimia marina]CUH51613.1 ATP-binding/permease protein CydD [Shimia marina]SFD44657.1 ATP-binding cassette, subfamily C, CydD [Shimia marina]